MRTVTLLLASTFLLGGCFKYVEASPEAVPAGENVRMRVSRTALAELPEEVAARGPVFAGTLLPGDDVVTVQVPLRTSGSAFTGPLPTLDVRVAGRDIVQFERKELDVASTALLVGGAAGLTFLALRAFVFGDGGEQGRDDPGGELIRIPLWPLPGR